MVDKVDKNQMLCRKYEDNVFGHCSDISGDKYCEFTTITREVCVPRLPNVYEAFVSLTKIISGLRFKRSITPISEQEY